MDNIMMNVRAIAANEKLSIEKLAEKCDIDPSHLKSVSSGRAVMTARDIVMLSKGTGISVYNIQY